MFDWDGKSRRFGGQSAHWHPDPLVVRLNTPAAFKRLSQLDLLGFLDDFLDGSVDLEGNLYVLSDLKNCIGIELNAVRVLGSVARNSLFQTARRAKKNVKSHYDIPQAALDTYLDSAYQSYTCGIFEDPIHRSVSELVQVGAGRDDTFDSLERAQWRKFSDALALLNVGPGDSLLDIGCGYGGLLEEAKRANASAVAVGWTHSKNQALAATERLQAGSIDPWEVHEGDYRREERSFDRVASIGMVSHVGPRGLRAYCRRARARTRRGGLYLHHDLMIEPGWFPQNLQIGPVFNKKYVWPGFHWFTLRRHLKELEQAGFRVLRVDDLSSHYAKTTAAWHERLCKRQDEAVSLMGAAGFRAWQIFLAGISGSLDNGGVCDYRVLCAAV